MSIIDVRPVAAITRVHVVGAVDVCITRGDIPRLEVHGTTQAAINTVRTESRNGVLTIRSVGRSATVSRGSITVIGNGNVVIGGSVIDGCGDIVAQSFSSTGVATVSLVLPELVELNVSGSADVEVSDLKQSRLMIRVSGAGDVEASGRVEELVIDVSGAGDVDTRNLKARQAAVSVSGAGDVWVYAEHAILVSTSGAGDVKVYGQPPEREQRVSGVGSVKFR